MGPEGRIYIKRLALTGFRNYQQLSDFYCSSSVQSASCSWFSLPIPFYRCAHVVFLESERLLWVGVDIILQNHIG